MGNLEFEKIKDEVLKNVPGYCEYNNLSNEIIEDMIANKDYEELKGKIRKLGELKLNLLKIINSILQEKKSNTKVYNVEKGINMLVAFSIGEYYFNNKEIPEFINEKLKENFFVDCSNGYLMVSKYLKKQKVEDDVAYEVLAKSFIYLYDLIVEVYKVNGMEGLSKYIKILNLFKKNYKTSLSSINLDDNYKNYIILLTSNNNLLNQLNIYDLYLIMLNFSDDKFLKSVMETDGKIIDDIAALIIRRKKDGISRSEELKQLMYLSNNISKIPSYEQKNIKL